MAMALRDALQETISGWADTVPVPWRSYVTGVTLDYDAVDSQLRIDPWVPIFPNAGAADILGAPKSGNGRRVYHTFRALQLVRPEAVRVVILGQDPYPDVAKATGASFEQGDLIDWVKDEHRVSSSLRAILQCAAEDKTGDTSYRDPEGGWDRLVRALAENRLKLASPASLFAAYGTQGVLWLNTTLTISLFREGPNKTEQHQKGHAAYWKPLVNRLLGMLATRPGKGVVFGLWGKWAKSFEEPLAERASQAGSSARVAFVRADHPVNRTFLTKANSLTEINVKLRGLGEAPIDWMPA